MDYYSVTDQAITQLLGERVRALRLRRNRTQTELAAATTLSLGTVKALEAGRGKLENLVAVLRELGALESLDAFLPEPGPSPLDLARRKGRTRQRASGRRKASAPQAKDTDGEGPW